MLGILKAKELKDKIQNLKDFITKYESRKNCNISITWKNYYGSTDVKIYSFDILKELETDIIEFLKSKLTIYESEFTKL